MIITPIIGPRFVGIVSPLINEAKHFIEIIVFDWRLPLNGTDNPVANLLLALQKAKERGVVVRVLVSNAAIGEQLQLLGFEVKMVYTRKLMHCKLMLIDRKLAVIGSHNYTLSAFTQNLEASIAVELPSIENDFSRFYSNLWGV